MVPASLLRFAACSFLFLASGCIKASESDPWRDFEVFTEDSTLASLDFDYKFEDESTLAEALDVDRERTGIRFAWGGETSRGFFHVFQEDWGVANSQSGDFEGGGAGGGAMGNPVISDAGSDLVYVMPWRVDLSLGYGSSALDAVPFDTLIYSEFHADLGFGVQWKDLQPTVGVAYSNLVGFVDSNVKEGEPLDEVGTIDVTGNNIGLFVDLKYRPEDWAVYGHVRATTGDYESTILGIGFRF